MILYPYGTPQPLAAPTTRYEAAWRDEDKAGERALLDALAERTAQVGPWQAALDIFGER